MLDAAHRLKTGQGDHPAPEDLHVEVSDGEILVTLPGTSYAVRAKLTSSLQLSMKHYPVQVDRRSPLSHAEFIGKAWKVANDKARELGWIA
jgi:hypothetical protein